MPKNHPQFATKTSEGIPVWPQLRTIDGYHYLLDSQHQTKEEADKRVAEIRDGKDAAQAFTSNNPKFCPAGDAYTPAFAAVYTVPNGKRVELTDDAHKITERPSKAKPKPKAKNSAKKAPAKRKSTKTDELKAKGKGRTSTRKADA